MADLAHVHIARFHHGISLCYIAVSVSDIHVMTLADVTEAK